ncbi:UPF0104 family protein [Methanobacterium aggregans]|uniref:UPF0104 family protein n=1 Tax=Methanobacterium aggregans TaxID=1615586 RepID=UPI001AE9562F|nr:UPF0104 family protein [Methanobacterium aggregans]MBP2045655.1 uncharacterized protein (TIRG00374 family) [Methanobacterium aggregans]
MQTSYEFILEHKWEIVITFIIGAFIIFLISVAVGLEDIINVLSHSNLQIILLAIFLELILIVAWTLRWSLILKVVDHSPRFKDLFLMMFTSLFGNNVTPGAAGGEPLRAYLVSKFEGVPFDLAFVSASADRVFEFFPFLLVSLFAIYMVFTWNISTMSAVALSILILITMTFFGLLIYVGINKDIAQRIIIRIARAVYPFFSKLSKKDVSFSYVKEKLIYYVERFTTGFLTVLKNHKIFTLGLGISFGMWGIDMVRMYLCFMAVGSYPPFVPMVIIYSIALLVTILPTLPGALGLREGVMVGLFLVVGVPADVVLAASLIDRVISYLIPTAIGAITTAYYGNLLKKDDSTST